MIRRDTDDSCLLFTQYDHSLLAGEFARRIGNSRFAVPSPYQQTIEGIAHHDSGWPLHDDHPTLNSQERPLHVFEASVALATQMWTASVARAMNLGDYQGLLVSLHAFALSAIHISNAKEMSRPDLFEMNKFQHRQIEIQHDLRQRLGLSNEVPLKLGLAKPGQSHADDQLLYNFRLLTAMDRISLSLCCGKLLFPTLDDVPPRSGEAPIQIKLQLPDPDTMLIDPWPFDESSLRFEIPSRRMPQTPFKSLEQFQDAYQQTPAQPHTLTLSPNEQKAG